MMDEHYTLKKNVPRMTQTRLYIYVYILSYLNDTDEILIDTNIKSVFKFLLYTLNLYIYILQ